MIKKISAYFMGLTTLFGALAFADTAVLSDQSIDGKFYVEPGTVYIAPDGIFLNVEDNFVPISGVCVDEGGIYVLGYGWATMVRCQNPKCRMIYDADTQQRKCPHNPL